MNTQTPQDPDCVESLRRLLAQPDPPDLPRRRHVYRCVGDPARRTTRLPVILMAWLQRRHLDLDLEEPPATGRRAVGAHVPPMSA